MSRRNMRLYWARKVTPPAASGRRDKSVLQQVRREADLTQGEVAFLTGLARPSLAKIEGRQRTCRLETAFRLAAVFGQDVPAVFERQGSPSAPRPGPVVPCPSIVLHMWPSTPPRSDEPPGAGSLLALLAQLPDPLAAQPPGPYAMGGLLSLPVLVMAVEGREQSLLDAWVWARLRWGWLAAALGCSAAAVPPTPAEVWTRLKLVDGGAVRSLLREWSCWQEPPAVPGSLPQPGIAAARAIMALLWAAGQAVGVVAAQLEAAPARRINAALRVLRADPRTLTPGGGGRGHQES